MFTAGVCLRVYVQNTHWQREEGLFTGRTNTVLLSICRNMPQLDPSLPVGKRQKTNSSVKIGDLVVAILWVGHVMGGGLQYKMQIYSDRLVL